MLRDASKITMSFQDNIIKSGKECAGELEKIRDLSYNLNYCFYTFINEDNIRELLDSLIFWCYAESTEILGYTIFLSSCGLYRNAYENVRHILELSVQAYYIDIKHPNTSFETKLEILKEIEGAREYHARKLIEEKLSFRNKVCKGLDCKGFLTVAYRNPSQRVHPSHDKVIATRKDFMSSKKDEGLSNLVECEEVAKIFDSIKTVLDVFYVLVISRYPDFLDIMMNDKDFVKCVKKYELKLLTKVFSQSKHRKREHRDRALNNKDKM